MVGTVSSVLIQKGVGLSSVSLVAGLINQKLLKNLVTLHTPHCDEVRAAIAYADTSNLDLLESCKSLGKPLTYYGRYDQSVPVHPNVIRWFLNQKNPNYVCRVVPDILHAKVIWWVGVGAYIGSANMTNRAWISNIEAGIFLSEDSAENYSAFDDLKVFFDVVEAKSHPVDDAFYRHLLDLSKRSASIDSARYKFEQEAPRYFPISDGLATSDARAAVQRNQNDFEKKWLESHQFLRDIADRVSSPEYRPSWIPEDVPKGSQTDQFIHAYYYKNVRGHRGIEFVNAAQAKNSANRMAALEEAMRWWKASDFDYADEQLMLMDHARTLKAHLSKEKLMHLTIDEFVQAMCLVHAFKDHANKRSNLELGLPDATQPTEIKAIAHAKWIWNMRSSTGRTVLEVLNYVVWGSGSVESRVWHASNDQASGWVNCGLGATRRIPSAQ
jgi:hypothetical protein